MIITEAILMLTSVEAAGNASPSMSQVLLQTMEDRYAGTEMYEVQKDIAIDATGIAYVGVLLPHIPRPLADVSM